MLSLPKLPSMDTLFRQVPGESWVIPVPCGGNGRTLTSNGSFASLQSVKHGSYNFKQTKFKDFSRTFQGQKLVFKDSVLFTKLTFVVPLSTLKTLNSVITYLRYVNS